MMESRDRDDDIIQNINKVVSEITDNGESFRLNREGLMGVIKGLYPNDTKEERDRKFSLFTNNRQLFINEKADPGRLRFTEEDRGILGRMRIRLE